MSERTRLRGSKAREPRRQKEASETGSNNNGSGERTMMTGCCQWGAAAPGPHGKNGQEHGWRRAIPTLLARRRVPSHDASVCGGRGATQRCLPRYRAAVVANRARRQGGATVGPPHGACGPGLGRVGQVVQHLKDPARLGAVTARVSASLAHARRPQEWRRPGKSGQRDKGSHRAPSCSDPPAGLASAPRGSGGRASAGEQGPQGVAVPQLRVRLCFPACRPRKAYDAA